MRTSTTNENCRILTLDEGYRRILAIGDMHGCVHHLRTLLDAVQPAREDLVVTLGDYIDRGQDSKGVIDTLLELRRDPEVNIVSLRGNHDAMLLMCFDSLRECRGYWPTGKCHADSDDEMFDLWCEVAAQPPPRLWLANQAISTLASFGKLRSDRNWTGYLKDIADEYWKGLRNINETMCEATAELVPQEYIDFLRETCVDAVETDSHIFVHGGLCPDLPLGDQPLFALHWARFDKAWKPHISGKKVVCGHTPQPDLLVHDLGHTVCLDTGAYMAKGFLTCMDVLSGQVWQINDDLQLIQQPVVHYDGKVPFVRISDLPEEERERFETWLMSHSVPFDGCAWPRDYSEWQVTGKHTTKEDYAAFPLKNVPEHELEALLKFIDQHGTQSAPPDAPPGTRRIWLRDYRRWWDQQPANRQRYFEVDFLSYWAPRQDELEKGLFRHMPPDDYRRPKWEDYKSVSK